MGVGGRCPADPVLLHLELETLEEIRVLPVFGELAFLQLDLLVNLLLLHPDLLFQPLVPLLLFLLLVFVLLVPQLAAYFGVHPGLLLVQFAYYFADVVILLLVLHLLLYVLGYFGYLLVDILLGFGGEGVLFGLMLPPLLLLGVVLFFQVFVPHLPHLVLDFALIY